VSLVKGLAIRERRFTRFRPALGGYSFCYNDCSEFVWETAE